MSEERDLKQDLKDATSSLRWMQLALFFLIIAGVTEFTDLQASS